MNEPTRPAVALPRLNAILDYDVARRAGWSVAELAKACLAGGARFLQIRAKQLAGRQYLTLCDEIMRLASPHEAVVIVNDRADLARLCGAAGVHVGQDDLSPRDVRIMAGDSALIGLSTHTVEQVRAANTQPVDYVAVGPVFGTATKDTGFSAVGLDLVREAARLLGEDSKLSDRPARPIVAIGGITLDRAGTVIEAGATSVAVISDLLASGNPEARVREYLRVLE